MHNEMSTLADVKFALWNQRHAVVYTSMRVPILVNGTAMLHSIIRECFFFRFQVLLIW